MLLRNALIWVEWTVGVILLHLTRLFAQEIYFILHVFYFFFELDQATFRHFLILVIFRFIYVAYNVINACDEAYRLIQSFKNLEISFWAHRLNAVHIFL